MKDLIGELKVPGLIGLVLATTLGYSWLRGIEGDAAKGYWPAKDPQLMSRVLASCGCEDAVTVRTDASLPTSIADPSAE